MARGFKRILAALSMKPRSAATSPGLPTQINGLMIISRESTSATGVKISKALQRRSPNIIS